MTVEELIERVRTLRAIGSERFRVFEPIDRSDGLYRVFTKRLWFDGENARRRWPARRIPATARA